MEESGAIERTRFLLDYLAGLDANELAAKYGISQQAVAARLRYARERGDIAQLQTEINIATELATSPEEAPASAMPAQEMPTIAAMNQETARMPLGRDEIAARFGTLQDKHNLGRLRNSARVRIAAHESNIGRKDPAFRIQQELWIRRERARMLGLTLNDLRRLRGMNI